MCWRARGRSPKALACCCPPVAHETQKYTEQLKDWDTLFAADTLQLKKLGVKPQQRKWILGWTEKYRQGIEPYLIALKPKPKKVANGGAAKGGAAKGGAAKTGAAPAAKKATK